MRLLILTQAVDRDDPALGFFHRWIVEFARDFESIAVICLREGAHDLPANVEVHSLGKDKGAGRFAAVLRFYRLIFALRGRYDAVFVHMNPEYVVLGGLIWKMLGKKVGLWYAHKSVTAKLRLSAHIADMLFTPSRESLRIESGKIRIMGHGIDTDMFAPRAESASNAPLSIITAGRISPSKGYETLIRSFALMKGDATLSIVGAPATETDRAYEEEIKSLAKTIGVGRRVVFAGPRSHDSLPDVLRAADAFVNTSSTGSMDKAVLEAMACGLPVATSNEAFATMLAPYHLAFKEGDTDALADILASWMLRRSELPSLGAKLRDIVVRQHSLPRLVAALKDQYETGR